MSARGKRYTIHVVDVSETTFVLAPAVGER
jgi:hypothetical protein